MAKFFKVENLFSSSFFSDFNKFLNMKKIFWGADKFFLFTRKMENQMKNEGEDSEDSSNCKWLSYVSHQVLFLARKMRTEMEKIKTLSWTPLKTMRIFSSLNAFFSSIFLKVISNLKQFSISRFKTSSINFRYTFNDFRVFMLLNFTRIFVQSNEN